MFSNQISARELCCGNENDFSQLQNAQITQFDNSQCSQDFFSQTQCSSGSVESQGRKLQLFEKYMAKPSLFRSNSQGRVPSDKPCANTSKISAREPSQLPKPQTSYIQQMNINKNKAKERDERDMLSSIVHIVKECSDEVKENLHISKDGEVENTDKLRSSILSLTDQIRESSDKILKSVQCREEQVSMVEKLQRQLHEKEQRIEELLKEINSNNAQDSSAAVVEALKHFMTDQQNETDKRLQKLLEITQEELKLVKEQTSAQRSASDENNKNFQDIKYNTNRQIQDIEKRVVDELIHIRDDFERQKRDMESFYKNQLQLLQQRQTREIMQHLDQGFESVTKASMDFDLERHVEVLKDTCRSNQKDLQMTIKVASADQCKQYLKQNQDLYSSYQKSITNNLNQKMKELKDAKDNDIKAIADHIDQSFSEKSRAWKNDLVPKSMQAQLDELHTYHISEIQRLEKQIEEQKKSTDDSKKVNLQIHSVDSVLNNVYDFQSENQNKTSAINSGQASLLQRASDFLSPRPLKGTTWNSRAIFGRTNPSPVATVLPQRKSTSLSNPNILTNTPQPNSNMQQAELEQAQLIRQVELSDPRLPETVQQSPKDIIETDTDSAQQPQANLETPAERYLTERKAPKMKKVSKKRGKIKKSTSKKGKGKIKSQDRHLKEKETQNINGRVSQALALYDFQDDTLPVPLMKKNKTPKAGALLSRSGSPSSSRKQEPAGCFLQEYTPAKNIQQSDEEGQTTTTSLRIVDVLVKRKVGQTNRKSPVKQEKQVGNDVGTQESVGVGDFLSTPSWTASRSKIPESTDLCMEKKSVETNANRSNRSFEQKRRLCNFDAEAMNFFECVQKKKKINI